MGGLAQGLKFAIRRALVRQNKSVEGINAMIMDPALTDLAASTGITSLGVHHTVQPNEARNIFGERLKIGNNSVFMFSIEGIGTTANKDEVVAFEYKGQIKNVDGTTTLVDTPFRILEQKPNDVSLLITANNGSNYLKVQFINNSASTYSFSTYVKMLKVG